MGPIFVSYSRADRGYVERLVEYLAAAGVPCWYDHGIAKGDRFDRVIAERIDSCAAVIVVMTRAALESDWVANEIAYAEAKNKRILPLLLSGSPLVSLARRDYENVAGGAMPGPKLTWPSWLPSSGRTRRPPSREHWLCALDPQAGAASGRMAG